MLEVCQVTKHTPSPIFIVATDSLHHMQRRTVLDRGRGGEQDAGGDTAEEKQLLCVSVTAH